jgi:hypothetical protein
LGLKVSNASKHQLAGFFYFLGLSFVSFSRQSIDHLGLLPMCKVGGKNPVFCNLQNVTLAICNSLQTWLIVKNLHTIDIKILL